MARQTEEEEAAELAEQVYRNKTFLNIPFYAGTGGDYIKHFQAAYASKMAADPKTAKKKPKSLTPAQFKREEAARVNREKLLAAVPYGPQERPTAATGLLPMEVLPAARKRSRKLLAAVPYGPQERPTAATGLLPMEVLPAARTDAPSPVLSYKP